MEGTIKIGQRAPSMVVTCDLVRYDEPRRLLLLANWRPSGYRLAEMRASLRTLTAVSQNANPLPARKCGECCPVLFPILHAARLGLRCGVLVRHQKFSREKNDED